MGWSPLQQTHASEDSEEGSSDLRKLLLLLDFHELVLLPGNFDSSFASLHESQQLGFHLAGKLGVEQ